MRRVSRRREVVVVVGRRGGGEGCWDLAEGSSARLGEEGAAGVHRWRISGSITSGGRIGKLGWGRRMGVPSF